jgi:hypothetical protein
MEDLARWVMDVPYLDLDDRVGAHTGPADDDGSEERSLHPQIHLTKIFLQQLLGLPLEALWVGFGCASFLLFSHSAAPPG